MPRAKGSALAALLLLLGMALYLFALGAIDPPGLNVPPSIAYLLAVVLLMAAAALASVMAGSLRLNHLFAMLVLVGFAGVGGWIALGEGARSCTTQIGVASSASVGRSAAVSSSTCRVAFGAGAVLSLVMAGVAASLWWRARPTNRSVR